MKQHPIIKALYINENGTKVLYNEKPIEVKVYFNTRNTCPRKVVNFLNRTHSLPKLICEVYHGMRKDASYTIQRKDFNPDNDHYSNLFWGKRGGRIVTCKTKRSKLSKLKKTDIQVIIKRINKGETLQAIANTYGVSDMSIQRLKNKHIKKPLKVLKNAIINAKDKQEQLTACASYLGYKSAAVAIQKIGKHEFLSQTDNLLKQL